MRHCVEDDVMNLKNALVFLSSLALCVLAASCSNSGNDQQTGLDPRIRRLFRKTGLLELETEQGALILFIKTDATRSQMCAIAPQVVDADGIECVYVGSDIAKWDEIPGNTLSTLMNQNARRRNHVFAVSSDYLVLRSLIPLKSKPDVFRDAIEALAVEADNIERVYFAKDDSDNWK